jgi:hypothetical protein
MVLEFPEDNNNDIDQNLSRNIINARGNIS